MAIQQSTSNKRFPIAIRAGTIGLLARSPENGDPELGGFRFPAPSTSVRARFARLMYGGASRRQMSWCISKTNLKDRDNENDSTYICIRSTHHRSGLGAG